jgi:3-mercaptopyruvate sulfurtransferase SseA
VALKLRRLGIRRVRPLLGGFHQWKKLGFPLVDIPEESDAAAPSTSTRIVAEGPA